MLLNDICKFIENKISVKYALASDKIGFADNYDLNIEINSVKVLMDLSKEDDEIFDEKTLIITHHPPLFRPKTPTYTIHSNWDIIKGGANEALADSLNLEVVDVFHAQTGIGRLCKFNGTYKDLEEIIKENFPQENTRIVNKPKLNDKIEKIAIVSGFGLKNPDYIKLAKDKKADIFISGDLTHETAVLAKNNNLTLIDLGHHNSEIPGLYKLGEILSSCSINVEVINKGEPWDKL